MDKPVVTPEMCLEAYQEIMMCKGYAAAAKAAFDARDEITRLRAEIAALRAEREWEPISDKHKDGETWWLADARGMDIFACGYWDDEAEAPFQWRISDTERLHNDLFTHAMKPTQPAPEAT